MKRGFTLLEVMISLAILAVGLVAVSSLNGGAVDNVIAFLEGRAQNVVA